MESLLLSTQGEIYEKDLHNVIRTCSRTDLEKLLKTFAQNRSAFEGKKLPPQQLKLSEFNFNMNGGKRSPLERNYSPLGRHYSPLPPSSHSSSIDKINSLQNSPVIHRLNSPLKCYKNSEIQHYSNPSEGVHGSLERKQRFELKNARPVEEKSPSELLSQRRQSYDCVRSSNTSLNESQTSYSKRKSEALLNKKRHPRNSSTESLQSDSRWKHTDSNSQCTEAPTSTSAGDRLSPAHSHCASIDSYKAEDSRTESYTKRDENSRTLSFKSLESQTSSQDILYYLQQDEQRDLADDFGTTKHSLNKEQNHSVDNLLKSNLKLAANDSDVSSSMPELCRKKAKEERREKKKDRSVRFQVEVGEGEESEEGEMSEEEVKLPSRDRASE